MLQINDSEVNFNVVRKSNFHNMNALRQPVSKNLRVADISEIQSLISNAMLGVQMEFDANNKVFYKSDEISARVALHTLIYSVSKSEAVRKYALRILLGTLESIGGDTRPVKKVSKRSTNDCIRYSLFGDSNDAPEYMFKLLQMASESESLANLLLFLNIAYLGDCVEMEIN